MKGCRFFLENLENWTRKGIQKWSRKFQVREEGKSPGEKSWDFNRWRKFVFSIFSAIINAVILPNLSFYNKGLDRPDRNSILGKVAVTSTVCVKNFSLCKKLPGKPANLCCIGKAKLQNSTNLKICRWYIWKALNFICHFILDIRPLQWKTSM